MDIVIRRIGIGDLDTLVDHHGDDVRLKHAARLIDLHYLSGRRELLSRHAGAGS